MSLAHIILELLQQPRTGCDLKIACFDTCFAHLPCPPVAGRSGPEVLTSPTPV